ncbi:ATP-binding cassette domain-containing protein, partial [bacterium]
MKLEGLTFYYGNSLIFDDFDFSSDKSIIALVGPSGCGKTTLLKIISGYLKPSRINEIKIPKNPLFVIQEDSLMPWLTGEENLNFVNNDNTLHYSDEELFKVISPFIKKRAFEMSYGQRRLIEIYRAILAKPTLMLLDEPFNFLDKLY